VEVATEEMAAMEAEVEAVAMVEEAATVEVEDVAEEEVMEEIVVEIVDMEEATAVTEEEGEEDMGEVVDTRCVRCVASWRDKSRAA